MCLYKILKEELIYLNGKSILKMELLEIFLNVIQLMEFLILEINYLKGMLWSRQVRFLIKQLLCVFRMCPEMYLFFLTNLQLSIAFLETLIIFILKLVWPLYQIIQNLVKILLFLLQEKHLNLNKMLFIGASTKIIGNILDLSLMAVHN